MSIPREPLRRIAVIGSGPVGILAAIAMRRALPGCEVVVIGQQPSPAAFADWSPTAMPFTNKLHDRLGVDEADIIARAGGSYRLVTRYAGWGGPDEAAFVPYGDGADPQWKTVFTKACRSGARLPLSLAEVLAQAGRFIPPPPGQQTPVSAVDYALRWNPAAYRAVLMEHAKALQVFYLEAAVDAITPGEGENIAAISLAGQGLLEADLFVDCSGPQATVLAAHEKFAFADWSQTLPTRMVYLAQPGAPMAALEDRITLAAKGWLSEVAGRDGLQITLGTGAQVSREEALAILGAPARAVIALTPGRAVQPWIGNVVALGDAAARFEPLGPLNLDLAHRQLDLLMEMLPGRIISPQERAEYNRRCGLMMEGVREVLALHFASPEARRVFGPHKLPDRVAAVLDQFERRGRIPFREELPLLGQEQFALLAALGWKPGLPPAARREDPAVDARAHAAFDASARAALAFAPPYAQWLSGALAV